MLKTFLCLLVIGLLARDAAGWEPKPRRFGRIMSFQLTDQRPTLPDWDEVDFGPSPKLAAGERFAIVSAKLDKGRSIGKYDYQLGGSACLATSVNQQPFEPGAWEHVYGSGFEEIHLLYKVNEADAPYLFQLVLLDGESGILMGPGSGADAAPPEPVNEPRTETVTGDVPESEPEPTAVEPEPAPTPEPEASPAKNPEPEPAPEPEPKPVKSEAPKDVFEELDF